jgi:tetratricopeptide (TPR) repeat protein
MSDSTKPHRDDQMDRYARGELAAAEAREVAQESLADPELFENLTYSALAKTAMATRLAGEQAKLPLSSANVVRFPRKARVFVAGVAAAAAIVSVSLYLLRPSFLGRNQSHETAARQRVKPALAFSADPGQPVLLASGLQPESARPGGAPVFRSPEPTSRSPRAAGSIVSIEDGQASVDLGSLDGLAKGTELRVFRDEQFTQPIGRLIVTMVFRERARGRIPAGQKIPANSRVRAPDTVFLAALLQQVDALSDRGDSAAARAIAEKAAGLAQTADVPPSLRRKALERLAQLEYQAGALEAAERHYQSAVDSLNAEPQASVEEQAVALNNLAVLHLLRGDYGGAEAPLHQAASKSLKTDSTYGRTLNNAGVLAELRGDRQKAETLYASALRAFAAIQDSSPQERSAVETNLARLRSSR